MQTEDPLAEQRPAEAADQDTTGDNGSMAGSTAGNAPSSHPRQQKIDLSRDPNPGVANHALPDGAPTHPLVDLSRDPNPGVANHALPDDEE